MNTAFIQVFIVQPLTIVHFTGSPEERLAVKNARLMARDKLYFDNIDVTDTDTEYEKEVIFHTFCFCVLRISTII